MGGGPILKGSVSGGPYGSLIRPGGGRGGGGKGSRIKYGSLGDIYGSLGGGGPRGS